MERRMFYGYSRDEFLHMRVPICSSAEDDASKFGELPEKALPHITGSPAEGRHFRDLR